MAVWALLPAQLLNGVVLGLLYVTISLGLSIIFGVLGVVNFAHGILFALGAYAALTFWRYVDYTVALLGAVVAVALLGGVMDRVLLRRVDSADPLPGMLLTFGLAFMLEDVIRLGWGVMGHPFAMPAFTQGVVTVLGVSYSRYRLFVVSVSLVAIVSMWLLMSRTQLGRTIRAGSRDPEMVEALGIDLGRLRSRVFALGAGLAAFAGVLAAPLWGVHPAMGTSALLPSFVVVVLGGLGSFAGSVVAGLLVGIVVALTGWLWPPGADLVMYVLMAAVLALRPRGLFGEWWEKFE